MRFEAARGTQICGLVFHQSVLEEIITVPVDGAASGGAERHDCAEGDGRDEGVSHPSMMNVTSKAAQGSLCLEWRKVGKPRGRPGLQPAPARCLEGFEALLGTWFRSRGLDDLLSLEGTFEEEGELWRRYRCLNAAPTPEVGSEVSYHGTWWYALRSVVTSGIMLESDDLERGHEIEGVYCTPLISTARGYARPQVLFGDDIYHRVVLELFCQKYRINQRRKGGWQVYPSSAVSVAAVLVLAHAAPDVGEERVDRWEDSLEALVAVG